MKIISHRGFWQDKAEKNQRVAFERAVSMGFGIETDIRDSQGSLVISHDMPCGNEMLLTEFLEIVGDSSIPLAMNIKADGLVSAFKITMETNHIKNWFAFDMSIPDMRGYLQQKLPVFTRQSDVETLPAYLEQSMGIWLDEFNSTWYNANHVNELLQKEKSVCIVSPELHGRDHQSVWDMLRPLAHSPTLMLCTDFPDKARDFFGDTDD